MTPERWEKVREIFERAVESSDRNAIIAEACRDDEDLQREVVSLLAQHSESADSLPGQSATQVPYLDSAEFLPRQIGDYRILGVLGKGGMGTVYKAEQERPRRIVALKVVRPGWTSPDLLRRFELEPQALGRLQHPGIAQVYEAGTADTGLGVQPYFAMEYIQGETLRNWIPNKCPSVDERLEMMANISDAVHHAHERGIIHRDLKPANILVDSSGQPKILDFGVARLTVTDAQASLHTVVGQIVGTLAYMSPEQFLADPLELDTRSDIYSLGVILFEILAGRKPFDLSGGMHESARRIREDDPPRLGSINRLFRGDVEIIVAKAMAKEKSQRYSSAAALAADIRHYRAHEAITARTPSLAYQLRKFSQRHRALVIGGAAVFLALIAGAVATLREAQRVRLERDTAKAISDFLETDLLAQASADAQASPGTAPDPDLKVRTALDRAAARIDHKFEKQPQIEASLRRTISNAYQQLALYPEAQRQAELALELEKRTLGENHPDALRLASSLAGLYYDQGEYTQAESLFGRTLREQRRKLGDANPDTLATMNDFGLLYADEHRYSDAEPLLTEVLQVRRRQLGENHPDTLVAINNVAWLYTKQRRYAEAELLYVQVVDSRRQVLGKQHPETLISMSNLAMLYSREHKDEKAEPLMIAVLESQRRILGEKHPDTLTTMDDLAGLYRRRGYYARSEALLLEAVENWRKSVGETHPDTLICMAGLAAVYQLEKRLPEADRIYARVLDVRSRIFGPTHPETTDVMVSLARVRILEHSFRDAEQMLRKALQDKSEPSADDWARYFRQALLGASLAGQARYPEAEALLVDGYQGMAQHEDSASVDMRMARSEVGEDIVRMYERWNKPAKAAEWREKLASPRASGSSLFTH